MQTHIKTSGPGRTTRRVGAVDDFLVATQASGRLAFSADEIAGSVPSEGRALEAALRRRTANGGLVRVGPRTGFFMIVPPEHRAMGAPPVEAWLDDLMAHLGQPYYVGLLSAAAWRGSSHFALQETQVVTTVWLRPITVGRTRIRFFQRPEAASMPADVRQGAWGSTRLATPETLAIDLLQHTVCGIDRTAMALSELAASLDPRRLRTALDAGGDVPTAQRLGYLMDAIGRPREAKAVEAWIAGRPRRTVDLVPGSPGTDVDATWNVRGVIPEGMLS